jgi:cytosine deaminase
VAAGHLTPVEAYRLVSAGARRTMGLPEVEVAPGSPCELLAVAGGSLPEAIANASEDRFVFSRGRLISRTSVVRHVDSPFTSGLTDAQFMEAQAWR